MSDEPTSVRELSRGVLPAPVTLPIAGAGCARPGHDEGLRPAGPNSPRSDWAGGESAEPREAGPTDGDAVDERRG